MPCRTHLCYLGKILSNYLLLDKPARLIIRLLFGFVLILRRVWRPSESGCEKSRGQIESLIGHQTCRKRLIIPPMYSGSSLQPKKITQVHHKVPKNGLKVREALTDCLKFGKPVIWICFAVKSYFILIEN